MEEATRDRPVENETYRKVVERIAALSQSYTPEWRFDPEDPDIGSALAVVFARMTEQTYKRLSRVPEKNRVAFLNSLGADLLPAIPASGYVQFNLVNEEVTGVPVEEGTVVFADAPDAPDNIASFETGEPVYVTPAQLSGLYVTQDKTDTIVKLFDREEEEWKPVQLFGVKGKNRQCHELYMAHDIVLDIEREADIELEFLHTLSPQEMMKTLQSLTDPSVAVWEYATETGWEIFRHADAAAGLLRLHKDAAQPAFFKREIEGRVSHWIRVRLLAIDKAEKLKMTGVKIASVGREVLPDILYGGDEEQDRRKCLPFGERLDLYQTVYFGSREVLSKKGALCTLSFRVDFARIPLETNESQTFNWEWVMRRDEFKPNYEFDVSIDKVIWEYFNGTGWTRLFPTDEYEKVFSVPEGVSGQYETLTFLVPADMEPTLVNASETCFVRARILRIHNLYKLQGQYVLPVIENISMKYAYRLGQRGQDYILSNNMETYRPQVEDGHSFAPFLRTGADPLTAYFSFDVSPEGTPVKLLFDVVAARGEGKRHFDWEYSCGDKWRTINLIDGTGQLTKTGIVTFFIPPDISRKRIFGRECFWLRLSAGADVWDVDAEPLKINHLHMNVTPVREFGSHHTEYFGMELYQPDTRLDLPDKNITEAEVHIDELGRLGADERKHLLDADELEEEYDEDGTLIHSWVRWHQVEDFFSSGPEDRHFILHRLGGQIEFGNGKWGRIPPPSEDESIRVRYTTGGGAFANLPAGSIDRMDQSIGFINRVTNVSALMGGCDQELPAQGIRRATSRLTNQNRAITVRDYESLAMQASRDIERVKCFSGYDDDGRRRTGAITLVIQAGHAGEELYFAALKDRVLQYLKERIHPALLDENRLFVAQPAYVECRTYIELTMDDLSRVFRVKKEIEDRIEQFLDPIRGRGGAGWEIGSFPNTIQIQNAISDIHGIAYISKVIMNTYSLSRDTDRGEIDIRTIPRNRYILPVPGETEIRINANA